MRKKSLENLLVSHGWRHHILGRMFEVITLGSGSAGNSMLVRSASSAFLVDAGLSAKQLSIRLDACGVRLEDLSGVLLTHEHQDHCGGLKVLLNRCNFPVYCNPMTARAMSDTGFPHANWRFFQNGCAFSLNEFTILPFQVPHDAADPVGFRISAHGACLGVLTDLGYATRNVFDVLKGIQALLIETNYDEQLLQQDMRRPWSVKQRIQSRHGHLSNAAAARVIDELDAPDLRHVILGHLSRDCNSPDLAETCVRTTLETRGRAASLYCAGQDRPSPVFGLI
ncbi:MAG: MBL fold metallo-hydrolase [Verrucomicrobia bacterium]|nr:MBL fold metallo-hydrolase [Verrucomicrobiota bacterium]